MHSFSIEKLYHFKCGVCLKWWSIGDAENQREAYYCPWCGHYYKIEEAS